MSYHQKASQQTNIKSHEEFRLIPEHYQRDASHRNSGDRMTVMNRHHFTIFKKERKALLKKTGKTAHDNKYDAEIAALCALIMNGKKKKKKKAVSQIDISCEETMTSD